MTWVDKPWGRYKVIYSTPTMWVKTIEVKSWASLSLQSHAERDEYWHAPEGRFWAVIGDEEVALNENEVYRVPAGTKHRIINPSRYTLHLTEVAVGRPDEDDIIRYEDDYGRED